MVRLYQPDETTTIEYYQKKASTAFTFGDMVYIDSNGFIAPATASSTPGIAGLIYRTVKTTDTDYAQNTTVPILVPGKNCTFTFDVGTGSATQTNVGEFHDLADSRNIDVTADTFGVVFVTQIISATQVIGKMAVKSGPVAG